MAPNLRMMKPDVHDPAPNPAIKAERKMETIAVVTPNCAMASLIQIISYRMLQKPETRKKQK